MIKKDNLLVLSRKDELALKSPSNLAFMPYFFVQTNFPYTEVEGREFVRKNGNLTLSLENFVLMLSFRNLFIMLSIKLQFL